MRRLLVLLCLPLFLVTACSQTKASQAAGTLNTQVAPSGPAPTKVPVATPSQQADIDLVVRGWDVCLKKVGADLSTGQAYLQGPSHFVKFGGKQNVTFALTTGTDGQPVVMAGDDATRKVFDSAGVDCAY